MYKYYVGDKLYYVNPFVFTIEEVIVNYVFTDDDGTVFYMEEPEAPLLEEDLFDNLDDAMRSAFKRLDKFYYSKQNQILSHRPKRKE
jgi:hypothetical protein